MKLRTIAMSGKALTEELEFEVLADSEFPSPQPAHAR